jgi:hypothetical protein
MDQQAREIREQLDETRQKLADKLAELTNRVDHAGERVVHAISPAHQAREHPWMLFGGSVLLGYLAGRRAAAQDTSNDRQERATSEHRFLLDNIENVATRVNALEDEQEVWQAQLEAERRAREAERAEWAERAERAERAEPSEEKNGWEPVAEIAKAALVGLTRAMAARVVEQAVGERASRSRSNGGEGADRRSPARSPARLPALPDDELRSTEPEP